MQEATDYANTAQTEPARLAKAESDLLLAKQMAVGFQLDSQPIDRKMAWIKELQAKAGVGTPNLLGTPATQNHVGLAQHQELSPHDRGLKLLAEGRRELQRNELGIARRFAEEAAAGPYGVSDEAKNLLRSIEVEEYQQKQLAAERAFDTLQSAYRRHDYQQAANLAKQIDFHLLPQDKRSRLKDIMLTPDMQQVGAYAMAHPQTGNPSAPPAGTPAMTPSGPAAADDYARQVDAFQQIKFQAMRNQGLEAMKDATERFQVALPTKPWKSCTSTRTSSKTRVWRLSASLRLRRPVDSRLQQFKTMKAAAEFDQLAKQKMAMARNHQNHLVLAEEQKQKQIKELMRQYTALMKEAKYREAEMAAVKVRELDPDNQSINAGIYMARTQHHLQQAQDGKQSREEVLVNALNDVEDYQDFDHIKTTDPMGYPRDWIGRTKNRKQYSGEVSRKKDREKEIERRLELPITLEFKDTPLSQVIDDLRSDTNMNIITDQPALDEEGISTDRPITMKLEGVSMKSALSILLAQRRPDLRHQGRGAANHHRKHRAASSCRRRSRWRT